jgi:hypothetical protein
VTGKLERRQGTINVIAERVAGLTRPGRPEIRPATEADEVAELRRFRAAAPRANSFGRGRR